MNITTVGQNVQNFEMEVYDPEKRDFAKISLDEVKAKKSPLSSISTEVISLQQSVGLP